MKDDLALCAPHLDLAGSSLADVARSVLARLGAPLTFVVALSDVDERDLDEVGRLPGVAGVFAVRGERHAVRLPKACAARVVVLGSSGTISTWTALPIVLAGVREVWTVTPWGSLRRRAPLGHLASAVSRRGREALRRLRAADEGSWARKYAEVLQHTGASLRLRPEELCGERVLLVGWSLAAGGAERQIGYTARGLRARGRRPLYLAFNVDGPDTGFYRPWFEREGIPVRQMTPCIAAADPDEGARLDALVQRFGDLDEHASLVATCVRVIRQFRPAVVHAFLDEPSVIATLAGIIAGVPRIVLSGRNVAPYNFVFHHPSMRPAYQVAVRSEVARLVNNSAAGARSYADWLGIDANAIRVIHNGVEQWERPADDVVETARAAAGADPSAPLVGGVLRFADEKQPLTWIDVAAAVHRRRPSTRFILVGYGALERDVHAAIARHALHDVVRVVAPRADVAPLIAGFDVFLLTSRAEGFPNVLVEAQSLGVPVVSTSAGGAPEAFVDGESGFVAPVGDVERIAERVLALIDDRDAARRAGTRGAAYVRARFSIDAMLDATERVYAGAG